MTDSLGQEALTQKGQTPLYKELIEVIKEAQDLLKDKSDLALKKQVDFLHIHDIDTKLISIIKEYTNIHITNFSFGPTDTIDLAFFHSFGVDASKQIYSVSQTHAAFKDAFNSETGQLSEDVYDQYFGLLNVTFYMSLGLLTRKTPDGDFLIHPEEAAAGILHEIWHFEYLISHQVRALMLTTQTADFIKYAEGPVDKTKMNQVISYLESTEQADPKISKLLKHLKRNMQDDQHDVTHYDAESIDVIGLFVLKNTSDKMLPHIRDILSSQTEKVRTREMIVDSERLSDDFASRNGAYLGLVSLLEKLEYENIHNKTYHVNELNAPVSVVNILNYFMSLFDMSPDEFSLRYDPPIRRLELIVETAKHGFSNRDLPDEVKKDLKRQIDACEICIHRLKSHPFMKRKQMFGEWIKNMEKFGRLIKAPFDIRLSKDYEKLQASTRSLSRHNLYYLVDTMKK